MVTTGTQKQSTSWSDIQHSNARLPQKSAIIIIIIIIILRAGENRCLAVTGGGRPNTGECGRLSQLKANYNIAIFGAE